jgi:hypothetical protein
VKPKNLKLIFKKDSSFHLAPFKMTKAGSYVSLKKMMKAHLKAEANLGWDIRLFY